MKQTIEKFLPHRAPFIMLSSIGHEQDGTYCASLQIEEQNIFTKDGIFLEPGLVEHMAQSVAAINAFSEEEMHQESNEAKVGFIGAIKNLNIAQLPKVGDTITTHIKVMHSIMNAQIVEATTLLHNLPIASCELKIFIQNQ